MTDQSDDQPKPEGSALIGGLALGGAAALAPSARSNVTGRTRLYHGTAKENLDRIRDQGLHPHARVGGPAITDVLDNATRAPSQNYVFATPVKHEARFYGGQADFLRDPRFGGDARRAVLEDPIGRARAGFFARLNPFREVIEADVPLWRKDFSERLRDNPEAMGSFKNFYDKVKFHYTESQAKQLYESLTRAKVFDGGIDPEYIRGHKFKGVNLKEIAEYARAHPRQFAKGVGLTAGTLGLAGLGAHQLYKRYVAPKLQARNKVEKTSAIRQDAEKTVLAHYGLHKLASGPESNVHRDVGAYRFNRAAESNDIDDSRQYVFKAHDRKPQAAGDESGQGITFQEGVSG